MWLNFPAGSKINSCQTGELSSTVVGKCLYHISHIIEKKKDAKQGFCIIYGFCLCPRLSVLD